MLKLQIAIWSGTVALGVLFVLAVGHIWAAPIAAPTADPVEICTWLGCKPGAVSYTQDDGNISCAQPLEDAGFRGTFFYNGSVTQTWFATIAAAGHEVGAHLTDHVLNCTIPPSCYTDPGGCTPTSLWETPYTPESIASFREVQIDPNVLAIEAGTNKPVVSMAYPCGTTDNTRKFASEYYFLGARSYTDTFSNNFWWVYDVNPPTPPEMMLLYADTYYDDIFVDRAISEGKWAIVTMHAATGGCVGIPYIASHESDLWVAPVGDVLKYIKVRNAARFGNYAQTSSAISFDAGHSLSTMQRQTLSGTTLLPIVFDNPVTLNAQLPTNNGVWQVLVDSVPVSYAVSGTIGSAHSVFFTTTLGITRHVTISLTNATAVQLQDLSVRSDGEPGQNLGWLLAMIVMGTSGFAGLMKANRRQPRRTAMRGRD